MRQIVISRTGMQTLLYLVSGGGAVALGVVVSSQFIGRAHSQAEGPGPDRPAAEATVDSPQGVKTLPDLETKPKVPTSEAEAATPPGPGGDMLPSGEPTKDPALDAMEQGTPPGGAEAKLGAGGAAPSEDLGSAEKGPMAPPSLGSGTKTKVTTKTAKKEIDPALIADTGPGGILEGFMDPFEYDPAGKKDPFRPVEADRPVEAGELEGPFQPLQRFETDQLTVKGIIWQVREPKALIADPSGAVHTIRENTRVGRYNGYVASIREGEVVIVEPFVEDGRMTYSTRVLRISK